MSLYKLNESSDSLFKSMDFILDEASGDSLINYHKLRIDDLEKKN